MQNPFAAAKNRGLFTSNDSLARQLRVAFPTLAWPEKERSLGTKIGELDRGTNGWWLARPVLSAALAEHLEVPLADLGLQVQSANRLAYFAEFPELPPLELGKEAPCRIGEVKGPGVSDSEILEAWLSGFRQGYVRNPAAAITWLEIESGTGASFLAARLEACGRFEFRRVRSLAELGTRLKKAEPLAVQVEQPASQEDLLALAGCDENLALLVLTGFPPPTSEQPGYGFYESWELNQAKGKERWQLLLTHPHSFSRIRGLRWRLLDDWQTVLLSWVEARLRAHNVDTLFTAEGLQRWLQQFNTVQQAINTPRELLGLCRFCHSMPETRLPKPTDTQAGALLLKHLLNANTAQITLASTLIERHFNDRSQPWNEPQSLLDWAALGLDHPAMPGLAELSAIATASSAAARKQAALALNEKLQGRRVEDLIACGLLAASNDGKYALRPRFLIDLIARDQMIAGALNRPATDWALLCFDPARGAIIDTALGQLSLDQLLPIVNVVNQLPANDPRAIGLGETLFIVIGASLNNQAPLPDAFSRIGQNVAARMDVLQRSPLSRQLDSPQKHVQWQAACWAWSLAIKPAANRPYALDWLFPGWSQRDLGEDGYLHTQPKPDQDTTTALDPHWNRMLQVAQQWLDTLSTAPPALPIFCRPLLIRAAALGKWPAQEDWWHEVIDRPWAIHYLQAQLPEAAAATWAKALLPSFLNFCAQYLAKKTDGLAHLKIFAGGILQWLFSNTPPEDFPEFLQEPAMQFLFSFPHSLPPHLRRRLLQPDLIAKYVNWHNRIAIIKAIDDPDTLMKSLEFVTGAVEKLWTLAPRTAQEILESPGSFALSKETIDELAYASPPHYTHAAVKYLLNCTALDKEVARHWLTQRLQNSNASDEWLMELATRLF